MAAWIATPFAGAVDPDLATLVVFAVVYVGMFLGGLPPIEVDRTGVVLLGAIALIALGVLDLDEAARSIDPPTLAILFGFMVLSAQLRLGGFYTRAASALTVLGRRPQTLLALVIALAAALSAVFTNDIVCLAMAPVVVQSCRARALDPVPFLIGLACAANVGSAATLIGNPQNVLIGAVRELSFAGFVARAAPVVVLGLGATWAVIAWQHRGRFVARESAASRAAEVDVPEFDRWQTAKGLALAGLLCAGFLLGNVAHGPLALAAAGVILLNTRVHSRRLLALVDWDLLVLFAGLFVVNHAFQETGFGDLAIDALAARGVDLAQPGWLALCAVPLSNLVSNVPAVMLLLPAVESAEAARMLAVASTLAGNLLLIGSVANLIVAEVAGGLGVRLDWRRHARTGVPVTLATLGIAALWWSAFGG